MDLGDYIIPQGWLAQVAQNIAHNLPELFPEPDRFDPLRYAPDRAEDKQDRFALIGFGGGTHKCTGMNFANLEMTLITAQLLQRFELELLPPAPTVEFGLGASRPSATRLRYRSRRQVDAFRHPAQELPPTFEP